MMNLKAKTLAAAAALAFAGAANAAIDDGSPSGNGELFFSAWDSVTETSYTRDLGLTLSQFVDQVGSFGTSAGGALGASNLVFGADSVLVNWLSGLAAPSLAALQWNVAAMDGASQNRYLTTAGGAITPPTTHGQLQQLNDNADTYIANVNNGPWVSGSHAPGTDFAVDGSSVIAKSANASGYAGSAGSWGSQFGNKTTFSNAGGLDDNLAFYVLYSLGTTTLAGVGTDQFDGAFWNFASDGTLSYNAAAAIPVPGAVWLLGSGLLGLAAVSRRRRLSVEAKPALA
jgi:hypothetical protein